MTLRDHIFVREPIPFAHAEIDESCPHCFERLDRCRCADNLPAYAGAFLAEGRH